MKPDEMVTLYTYMEVLLLARNSGIKKMTLSITLSMQHAIGNGYVYAQICLDAFRKSMIAGKFINIKR